MRSPLLLIGCLVSLAMLSCGKDDDDEPAKTKTQLLTAQVWRISTVGADVDKNGTVDLPFPLEACDQDDRFTFRTDGSGTLDEGATKCDPADPQTEDFTWQFKSNETILNITIPNSLLTGDMNIKTLDASKLEVFFDFDEPTSGQNVRVYVTLIH